MTYVRLQSILFTVTKKCNFFKRTLQKMDIKNLRYYKTVFNTRMVH